MFAFAADWIGGRVLLNAAANCVMEASGIQLPYEFVQFALNGTKGLSKNILNRFLWAFNCMDLLNASSRVVTSLAFQNNFQRSSYYTFTCDI